MKPDVFISYRRAKSDTATDSIVRLKSDLQRRLTSKNIYLDIHGAPTGETIQGDILQLTKASHVFVIAINHSWNEAMERLRNPNDYVRMEIELALSLDLIILPIVFSDGRLPSKDELPESLRGILDRQATFILNDASYDDEINKFAQVIKDVSPNVTIRVLNWLAENNAANIVFGLVILGGLLLFLSRVLNIHLFPFVTNVELGLGSSVVVSTIQREVGVIMAWNWTAAIIVINPMMVLIACNTLKVTKEFLDKLQVRQMLFYIDNKEQRISKTARKLWRTIIEPTAIWCQAFIALATVLGIFNWWRYSGQWYFKEKFDFTNFMMESTGPDWNIAWLLGADRLAGSGESIITFTLLMYLVYGIGTAITFSFYAFLFNFSSTLSHLAATVGTTAKTVLMLDVKDQQNGGLADLRKIQTFHASFCYWSLAAMYVMSLRNAYLPLVCRIPEELSSNFNNQEAMLEQCTTMVKFISTILLSFLYFLSSLFEGQLDFRILFFNYSEQNEYVLGSMLYVLLIASFFFLISTRMKAIILSAQSNTKSENATSLARQLSFENMQVLSILFIGALSTVFLNLGPFVLVLALCLMVIDKVMHGSAIQ